jgi:hypothetical protein
LDIIGAVTAGAAGLAAVLAGANLYISGRRELNKWTRESLVEIFAVFLDASFKHASACGSILNTSPPRPERNQLQSDIFEAHSTASRALTRLRLLAPPAVVRNAIALLEVEYLLAESCFSGPLAQDETLELIRAVRQARAKLLTSARSALGLRDTEGTGDFDINVNWRDLCLRFRERSAEEQPSDP